MGGMKKAIRIPSLTEEQQVALDQLYRKTKLPRVRTRAQMILLSAEQGLKAEEIAVIVRESAVTVLTWLKRYRAEGIEACKMRLEQVGAPQSQKNFENTCWKVSEEDQGV
jgi:DNA-directed RNA polymerase specialized sigma24 family protein